MASLYSRGDILWVKYRTASGIGRESTHCRADNPVEVRQAQRIKTEKTIAELSLRLKQPRRPRAGWEWISDFLAVRYGAQAPTLERYTCCWDTLRLFLEEKKIIAPSQLRRQHCFDYVAWRTQPADRKAGRYRACRNTALLDLKVLRVVMREAVERELAIGNPCVQLGLKKAPRKLKPALTEEHYALIEKGIAAIEDTTEREFFEISFAIARYQGCRVKETRLNPLADVSLAQHTITFRVKGGEDKATLLHPKLVPLFERLQGAGRTYTWKSPENAGRQWASNRWGKFLRKLNLKAVAGDGACFHSTRVTVATRMVRAGVHPSKAKAYLIHASTLTHELYQRLRPHDDLAECAAAIG